MTIRYSFLWKCFVAWMALDIAIYILETAWLHTGWFVDIKTRLYQDVAILTFLIFCWAWRRSF